MNAHIEAEERIEWTWTKERVEELEYLREGIVTVSHRRRSPSLAINGKQVGYAILAEDVDPLGPPTGKPQFHRRVFYLKPGDPYGPPCPVEAVVPSSVTAGVKSDPWFNE